MKKITPLLLTALLLFGCAQPQPEEPVITESLVWEEAPQLNHGVLEYDKLTPQPWHCGQLEFTSRNRWAETELGYYYFYSGENTLYYADKVNLGNWVPVCNKPDCGHTMMNWHCNSHLGGNSFLIRDGRIYFAEVTRGKESQVYLEEGATTVMCSRALNGTDIRMEYYIEDALITNGGSISSVLSPEWWLVFVEIFNPDGTYANRLFRRTETELELERELITDERSSFIVGRGILVDGYFAAAYQGDDTFFSDLESEFRGLPTLATLYRYVDGEMEPLDCVGYELTGKYLSGNTLRLYRENDGYYDLDLTTRQETFVCEAQLPDATAKVLLPNCIVEYNSERMVLFDGVSWREVEIPEELQGQTMTPDALASDRIFLAKWDGRAGYMQLYQIVLTDGQLELESCGDVFRY